MPFSFRKCEFLSNRSDSTSYASNAPSLLRNILKKKRISGSFYVQPQLEFAVLALAPEDLAYADQINLSR